MKVLKNEEIILLKRKVDDIIYILQKYDECMTAKFRVYLQIISRNVEKCILDEFDGIEELSQYIYEDWRKICVGNGGIENWYLNISDLELKGEYNKKIEEICISIEKILGTNFVIPRIWLNFDELNKLKCQYYDIEEGWNSTIKRLKENRQYYNSPIEQIPSDIWSFAMMLCIMDSEKSLEDWFYKDIPAFGYVSPMQLVKMEYGENILRVLMYGITI